MPIKDPQKAREYKRLWIAQKRSQLKNVEPSGNVEPQREDLFKCAYCPQKVLMEKKYTPYFAPICSNACLNKAKKKENHHQ